MVTQDGKTPLQLAADKGHSAVVDLLKSRGAKVGHMVVVVVVVVVVMLTPRSPRMSYERQRPSPSSSCHGYL